MRSVMRSSELLSKHMMLVFAISMLASCGGGSGGASPAGPNTPPPSANITPSPSAPPPAPTGTATSLSPTSGRHIAPKIVFNGAGTGLAVWESADGDISTSYTGRAIWYSLYQNGQWSQEAIVQVLPDTDSISAAAQGYFELQAAASATGFAITWLQHDRTNSAATGYFVTNLYARVFSGGSWGSVSALETRATPANSPVIASNGTGYLVAWNQYNDSTAMDAVNGNIYSGGAWHGATEIASSSNHLTDVRVASNGAGYATAWGEVTALTYWNNARLYNGSWGAVQAFNGLSGYSGPSYLESSGGSYLLAWNQNGAASSAYTSTGSGTSWSAPAVATLPNLLGLKAGNSGYAAVYSCTGAVAPSTVSLCGEVYAAGAWGNAIPLGTFSGSTAATPVLASDGSGWGVLWRQYNSTTSDYDVYHTTFTATAAAAPIQVAAAKSAAISGVPPSVYPREAIAYDGTGYMLGWIQHVLTATTNREEVYAQHYSGATASTKTSLLTLVHDSSVYWPTITVNNAGVKLATWQQYYFDTSGAVPTYLFGLFAAVTDTSGNWGTPMLLAPYGSGAQVVTNGTSFAIAYAPYSQSVAVRVYANGTLSAEQQQSIAPAYDPRLISNGSGYMVSWWEVGSYPIYASIYNGTNWSGPVSIGGAYGYGAPQVATNKTGYAVAWQHYDSVTAANHAYANVFDGTAWLGAQPVDTQPSTVSIPHIASNGTGYALLWQQSSGTYTSIYASMFAGTAWSAPTVIDGQAANAQYPEVISNGSGYASAWQQGSNCYARVWSAGSWGTLSNVGACLSARTSNQSNLVMATDGVGYAFAFEQVNSTPYAAYAATYSNGTWSGITGIMPAGCVAPTSSAWMLVGGSGGYGMLSLCTSGLYSSFDLYGSFFHGSTWSSAAPIENGAYAVNYGIGLRPEGNSFTALWTQAHESQTDPSVKKIYTRSGL